MVEKFSTILFIFSIYAVILTDDVNFASNNTFDVFIS
ncbi:hypothetical protein DOY81_007096 [Sarcophaga bullata]|nr:hypothetical protein DOY81_007096 [Sarcophaga bullata]